MTDKELTESLYARFLDFKPTKGDLRRIAIIESAIDCISSIGVEAATLEAIGKRRRMAKAHVAYYFKDRRSIVEAAIKFVVATVQSFTVDHVRQAKSEKERLDAFVDGTFAWAETFPKHAPVILLLYYYASHDARYRRLHDDIRSLGAERIGAVLHSLVPKDKRKAIPSLAKLVQSILTGNMLDHFTTDSSCTLEELRVKTRREIQDAVRLCVGA